jgi:hypothetical protein
VYCVPFDCSGLRAESVPRSTGVYFFLFCFYFFFFFFFFRHRYEVSELATFRTSSIPIAASKSLSKNTPFVTYPILLLLPITTIAKVRL